MSKPWTCHVLALAFLTLGVVRPLGADPERVQISIGEQPPLLSSQGGIVNLVIAEALLRASFQVEYHWLPIGRMLKNLEEDSLDVYVTPSNTQGQQNPHVDFLSARGVFFFRVSEMKRPSFKKLEDLAGYRVATVINSPLTPLFKKAGILVDEGPFESLFKKLEAGRVDFTATADVGGILTIASLFPGREHEFDFTEFSYSEIRSGLYAKPGPRGTALLAAARRGLASMKADGTLAKMLASFFGTEYAGRVKIY